MDSNLPPIDFKEDKKYDHYSESKEVKFEKCNHSDVKIANGELRCKCGIAWAGTGSEIKKLFDVLTKK